MLCSTRNSPALLSFHATIQQQMLVRHPSALNSIKRLPSRFFHFFSPPLLRRLFFLFWRNSFDCWRRLLQLLFCICGLRPCTLLFNLCFYSFTALTRLSFARLLRRIKHVTICGASLSAERGKKVFWDAAVELCMCVQKMRWWRVPLDGRLTARINCQTLLLLLLLLLLLPAPLLVPTPPP